MKKVGLLPLLFTFFAALLLMQCDNKAQTEAQPFIHYEDQIDSTRYYSYKIDFPDTLYYTNLAKAMKIYATAARDSFFVWMPKDTASLRFPWQLMVDFKKAVESPRFVGYQTLYYRFTGGAHGMPATKTFVYDKKKEQIIELKDLFSDTAAVKAISRYAQNAIARNVYNVESFKDLNSANQEWVKEGAKPAFANFAAFLPTRVTSNGIGGLKIIFSPYQVAPYAVGMPAVIIPADQFYRYLAPEYKKVFIQDK